MQEFDQEYPYLRNIENLALAPDEIKLKLTLLTQRFSEQNAQQIRQLLLDNWLLRQEINYQNFLVFPGTVMNILAHIGCTILLNDCNINGLLSSILIRFLSVQFVKYSKGNIIDAYKNFIIDLDLTKYNIEEIPEDRLILALIQEQAWLRKLWRYEYDRENIETRIHGIINVSDPLFKKNICLDDISPMEINILLPIICHGTLEIIPSLFFNRNNFRDEVYKKIDEIYAVAKQDLAACRFV